METANHKTHAGKLGRNEPCSCGSGKKYKTCCYASKANHQNVDPDWRKIRQTEGELIDKHLTPYVSRKYGKELFGFALDDFYMGIELSKDLEDGFFREVFIPWCLFNWVPNVEGLPEQPIAMTYLIEHKSRLTTYERGFIEAMGNSYFSFYQVMGVEYEKSVSLRDIILSSEHKIKEISGTHYFKIGHILYARILSYGNQEIAIGVAPTMLPTHGHTAVIDWMTDFQKQYPKVPFTPAILVAEEEELRAICMTSMEAQFKPRRIVNTDGDPFEPCDVIFQTVGRPDELLVKIMPMSLGRDMDDILEDAERDKKGQISKISFSWLKKGNKQHKNWDNTILGEVTIQKGLLTISVNSLQRAEKARKLINKYLGKLAQFSSFEKPLNDDVAKSTKKPKAVKSKEHEELMGIPEVQEALKEHFREYWKNWLDKKIPLLDNMTPREASKHEVGRKKLEALLLDFETDEKKELEPFAPNINELRQELGMA